MKGFIIRTKISPCGISATMNMQKRILHYEKIELYKLIEIVGLSVYSGVVPALSDEVGM